MYKYVKQPRYFVIVLFRQLTNSTIHELVTSNNPQEVADKGFEILKSLGPRWQMQMAEVQRQDFEDILMSMATP